MSNADLGEIMASNNGVGPYSLPEIAGRRSATPGAAPVYLYQFGWYSPVHEGKVRSMHCLDLPFVFDHVDDHTYMVGGGQDRYALADKVSAAWAAFVCMGNPNHAGIPRWAPFTAKDSTMMLFNTESRAVNDAFGEERRAIRALRPNSA